MAAPTLVQEAGLFTTGNNTSEDLSGTSGSWDSTVTAGSTLIAFLHQPSSDSRTFGVEDDVDGSWTALTAQSRGGGGGFVSQIFYITNHTGGTVTVTVTSNANVVKEVHLVEISDSTFDVESSIAGLSTDIDGTLGYPCSADSTVIDTAADVFVIAGVTIAGGNSVDGGGSGYTNLHTPSSTSATQYKTSASALTNERGWVAESGTNRNYSGAIASFVAAGGGGGATAANFMTLLGVGA